jgi:hypothetical protein
MKAQALRDYYAICEALGRIGAMREPEIAAATGLDEDRVYRACKRAVRLGHLTRRAFDGELSQTPINHLLVQADEAFT